MFPLLATNFELFPTESMAARTLARVIQPLQRLSFNGFIKNPAANQGQLTTDFDQCLCSALIANGAAQGDFRILVQVSNKKHDFVLKIEEKIVVFEVEKSNRYKFLDDLLKCHMYLNHGADFAAIVLPRNYPHKMGIWNLYKTGVSRYQECLRFGFGTEELFQRVVIVGYDQADISGELLRRRIIV